MYCRRNCRRGDNRQCQGGQLTSRPITAVQPVLLPDTALAAPFVPLDPLAGRRGVLRREARQPGRHRREVFDVGLLPLVRRGTGDRRRRMRANGRRVHGVACAAPRNFPLNRLYLIHWIRCFVLFMPAVDRDVRHPSMSGDFSKRLLWPFSVAEYRIQDAGNVPGSRW
jgi:hypothetical protein